MTISERPTLDEIFRVTGSASVGGAGRAGERARKDGQGATPALAEEHPPIRSGATQERGESPEAQHRPSPRPGPQGQPAGKQRRRPD
jgi:hypothetical protein